MENEKKKPNEKGKQGATVGDASVFDDVDQDSFCRSVNMVLAGLEAVVGYATNKRDLQSIESIQTCIAEVFRRSAECIAAGLKYKVGPPKC